MEFTVYGRLPSLNEVIAANRAHRHVGAKLKRDTDAAIRAQLPAGHHDGRADLTLTWYCADRRRDPDNVASAVKFLLDAMVAHGTIDGDRWQHIGSITHRFEVGDDRVEVELA